MTRPDPAFRHHGLHDALGVRFMTQPTGDTADGGGGNGGTPPADGNITYSQAELTRRMTIEKDSGRRAGKSELLTELGLSSVDDLKGIITAAKAAEEATKTEQQRLAEQATRDRADAERIKGEAAAERRDIRLERHLLRAGASPDLPAGAASGAKAPLDRLRSMLAADVPVDADEAAVETAVAALKAELPALFATTSTGGGGASGDPGAGPNSRPQAPTTTSGGAATDGSGNPPARWGAAGRARAAAMRPAPART